MANNYTFPAGQNTYVPSLTGNLIVDYSRNADRFPLLKYTIITKVEKQVGYYIKMANQSQVRVVHNPNDFVWADGNDAPKGTVNNQQFDFPQYTCQRFSYPFRLGYMAVDQAGWDILDQAAAYQAMQAMTARTDRVATVLTTGANWGANTATATALGGGLWSAATSTNPYIKLSLFTAVNNIALATNGAVQPDQLRLVLNPNAARTVATSQEFIDFLKQSPTAGPIFEGAGFWNARYGLPPTLYGIEVVVEDSVKVTSVPNATAASSFIYPDQSVVLLAKTNSIQGTVGGAFSTLSLFAYEEFTTEVLNDPLNRVFNGRVTENISTTLVAPESGFLITSIGTSL